LPPWSAPNPIATVVWYENSTSLRPEGPLAYTGAQTGASTGRVGPNGAFQPRLVLAPAEGVPTGERDLPRRSAGGQRAYRSYGIRVNAVSHPVCWTWGCTLRHPPALADAPDAAGLAAGGGGRLGPQRDLRRAKGPGRSILARSNSLSMPRMLISPRAKGPVVAGVAVVPGTMAGVVSAWPEMARTGYARPRHPQAHQRPKDP
jgi:hypothetical protein